MNFTLIKHNYIKNITYIIPTPIFTDKYSILLELEHQVSTYVETICGQTEIQLYKKPYITLNGISKHQTNDNITVKQCLFNLVDFHRKKYQLPIGCYITKNNGNLTKLTVWRKLSITKIDPGYIWSSKYDDIVIRKMFSIELVVNNPNYEYNNNNKEVIPDIIMTNQKQCAKTFSDIFSNSKLSTIIKEKIESNEKISLVELRGMLNNVFTSCKLATCPPTMEELTESKQNNIDFNDIFICT